MKPKPSEPAPPKHFGKRAAAFWRELCDKYEFKAQDLQRLQTACECIDTIDACAEAIRKDGLFTPDRYGGQRQHPGVVAKRDAHQLLLRALREMNIDVEQVAEPRLPRQQRRYA